MRKASKRFRPHRIRGNAGYGEALQALTGRIRMQSGIPRQLHKSWPWATAHALPTATRLFAGSRAAVLSRCIRPDRGAVGAASGARARD